MWGSGPCPQFFPNYGGLTPRPLLSSVTGDPSPQFLCPNEITLRVVMSQDRLHLGSQTFCPRQGKKKGYHGGPWVPGVEEEPDHGRVPPTPPVAPDPIVTW